MLKFVLKYIELLKNEVLFWVFVMMICDGFSDDIILVVSDVIFLLNIDDWQISNY